MKCLALLLVASGLVSCSRADNVEAPLQHKIDCAVKDITNCYQKDNTLAWNSGDNTADLSVSGRIHDGYPICILTTQINKHERMEVWLMKYVIAGTQKGKTDYKTLDFIVVEQWDDRIMAKKFWPWPTTLLFHIDTKDYRITNIEHAPNKPSEATR